MSWLKYASIVVQLVRLVLDVCGIKADFSKTIANTVTKTERAMRMSSAFQKAVREFLNVWGQPGASNMTKGVAILKLLWNMSVEGFFIMIIESLCSTMTKWEWAKASVTLGAMTVALFGSGGLALAVRIVLAVNSTVQLASEIAALLQQ